MKTYKNKGDNYFDDIGEEVYVKRRLTMFGFKKSQVEVYDRYSYGKVQRRYDELVLPILNSIMEVQDLCGNRRIYK